MPVSCSENFYPGILNVEEKEDEQAEPTIAVVQNPHENQAEDSGDSIEQDGGDEDQQPIDRRPSLRERIKRSWRYEVNIAEWDEFSSFQEAVSGPDADKWRNAIREELRAHEENQTWVLVPARKDKTLIDSKWVFKAQRGKSGEISRFKARLCARGFLQKAGLDYHETFSPVVRYDSLRVLRRNPTNFLI